MHPLIVNWVRENTTASLEEASIYASDCIHRYGNPERDSKCPVAFNSKIGRNKRIVELLRILAHGQAHKVVKIRDRFHPDASRHTVIWIAYRPSNGVIVAVVGSHDHPDMQSMLQVCAMKLRNRMESRILNRLLSDNLTNAKLLQTFFILTGNLLDCFNLRFENEPFFVNGVYYNYNWLPYLDRYVVDLMPMILDCAGWILEDDQTLTADEMEVKNYRTKIPTLMVFRCDKGFVCVFSNPWHYTVTVCGRCGRVSPDAPREVTEV